MPILSASQRNCVSPFLILPVLSSSACQRWIACMMCVGLRCCGSRRSRNVSAS